MLRSPSHTSARVAIAAAATLLTALVAFGPGLAGAETTPTGVTDTIDMRDVNGALAFVGPKTVTEGDQLRIVNSTNPKKVGPHTISLVTQGSLPKTKSARQKCFTPNHICQAIANWHGVKGEGPPTINPAKAGAEGWDTEGSNSRNGDSWFTGKQGQSFEQQVTVDASAGPRTIHFICAIHPWMQGSVKVLPVGGA
jgi:hypothetical protein